MTALDFIAVQLEEQIFGSITGPVAELSHPLANNAAHLCNMWGHLLRKMSARFGGRTGWEGVVVASQVQKVNRKIEDASAALWKPVEKIIEDRVSGGLLEDH